VKSHYIANERLGYLLAPPPLVQILTNTKAPYNISLPTACLARSALSIPGITAMANGVYTLNTNRQILIDELEKIPRMGKILGGNDANFVLVQVLNKEGKPDNVEAAMVYKTMAESRGVVVRFRGGEKGCEGCLRITVGTETEVREAVKQIEALLE
jgi:histidinol-phosphate aminotransferase